MYKKIPTVDVVMDVLKETLAVFPSSTFVASLLIQYQERGSLSKKQLQGLHSKASKADSISPGKLATLEAVILKMPTRFKSEMPAPTTLYQKDTVVEKMILSILEKYPQHKRVLFYKMKWENNEPFSSSEKTELERFYKLLVK